MIGSHTGLSQFNLISKLLDVLCLRCNETLVGVLYEGVRNMTGSVQGVLTRLQQASTIHKFNHVWCLFHQLEETWTATDGGTFMTTLLAIIIHSRCQQRLVDATRSTCPKMSSMRWNSLYMVTAWLDDYRVEVLAHYRSMSHARSTTAPTCPSWWLLNAITASLAYSINTVVQRLQGRRITLAINPPR
uniref:Uncharacterized protein n=2 Tax=Hyaloperonospora arabidopsidis (strain Emoy2) TaxID=559515 RepID=M4BE81_HYAAE